MYPDLPGVYKIINKANGNFYIGSAVNLRTRKNRHFSELGKGIHYNIHLQRAFTKYGYNCFEFVVLIVCDKESLSLYEQMIIDGLKPIYNIRKDATSNVGVKKSDEEKIRIGNFFRGKKMSAKHIENRDKSRILNLLSSNPMYNIQTLPSGSFRVKFKRKHLKCFKFLFDAQEFRTSFILEAVEGG